jgi:predicted DNA-binding transcriptional regulator AlpA
VAATHSERVSLYNWCIGTYRNEVHVDDESLLSIRQVCALLGITPSTWYRWKSLGWGPPVVFPGPPTTARKRTVRVRKSDLIPYLGGSHE